jgi:hypothetical protein
VGGDRAHARAEIDGPAVVGEQTGRAASKFLALDPGDIEARHDMQGLAAEPQDPGDPG